MIGRRISVIDIGSNSVRILVADIKGDETNELYKDLNTTRLYKDISPDYVLDNDSMERTVKAIERYVDIANEKSSDEIYMFATAAVRVAKNKNEFIKSVREKTRIILEVISEEREAEMAFAGVGQKGTCGVIDIGGASTEIVIGQDGNILSASSAKIGAVKCKEILESDKNSSKVISAIESILVAESAETIEYTKNLSKIKWYGVGGTITTMAAMLNDMVEYDSAVINETKISYDDLDKMIVAMQGMDVERRKEIAGLQPKRADIIVYGLLILQTVMKNCNISYVQSSDNDNLAGYVNLLLKET